MYAAGVLGGGDTSLGGDGCRCPYKGEGLRFKGATRRSTLLMVGADKILVDYVFEHSEGDGIDVQLPFEILTHFNPHLVDFLQLEHPLCDD